MAPKKRNPGKETEKVKGKGKGKKGGKGKEKGRVPLFDPNEHEGSDSDTEEPVVKVDAPVSYDSFPMEECCTSLKEMMERQWFDDDFFQRALPQRIRSHPTSENHPDLLLNMIKAYWDAFKTFGWSIENSSEKDFYGNFVFTDEDESRTTFEGGYLPHDIYSSLNPDDEHYQSQDDAEDLFTGLCRFCQWLLKLKKQSVAAPPSQTEASARTDSSLSLPNQHQQVDLQAAALLAAAEAAQKISQDAAPQSGSSVPTVPEFSRLSSRQLVDFKTFSDLSDNNKIQLILALQQNLANLIESHRPAPNPFPPSEDPERLAQWNELWEYDAVLRAYLGNIIPYLPFTYSLITFLLLLMTSGHLLMTSGHLLMTSGHLFMTSGHLLMTSGHLFIRLSRNRGWIYKGQSERRRRTHPA